MRTHHGVALLLGMVLAAGCGKKDGGNMGSVGTSPRTIYQGPLRGAVDLADQGTKDRVTNIVIPYILGPSYRLRDPEIVNVAKAIKTSRNGQEAEAFYVQFHASNNLAEEEQHQHDLFIIQGDKVLDHYRTTEEIKDRMSDVWFRKNPPPNWKPLERRMAQ